MRFRNGLWNPMADAIDHPADPSVLVGGICMSRPAADRMSNSGFRAMSVAFRVVDGFSSRVKRRVASLPIDRGMVVADYGCGPGRYTIPIGRRVGDGGRIYAIDVHLLALKSVCRRAGRSGLTNIVPVLANEYLTPVPDHCVDLVLALDMFHMVTDPSALLAEMRRITKPGGRLILEDGHSSRQTTLAKLHAAGGWDVAAETREHLLCHPGDRSMQKSRPWKGGS